MSINPTPRETLIVHGSDDIVLAMETTRKIAETAGFSERTSVLLQLVTEEACMNAFEHGCPIGNCEFIVSWVVESEVIEITVRQNGEAYELQHDLPNPIKGTSRGRGLVLIQGIMDEVKLIPTGAYVTLSMRKSRGA
ncbi:ATP-binding protein [Paenibacillus sp. sgz500958]|uniref:ATP-binding protein n=1 Tax=Paenibacillus sp. sgz500958 TaxID=3242475 RepID=UPI0036D4132A